MRRPVAHRHTPRSHQPPPIALRFSVASVWYRTGFHATVSVCCGDRSLYVPDIIKVYVVVKVSVIIIAYVVINVCIIINTCKVYVYDNSRKVRNVYHTLE
jgi:hypothetical protein